MPKSTVFASDVLKLIFNGTSITGLADNAVSGALPALFIALHTADPGVGGNQTTNEVNYTGYTRVQVNRTSGGWTITASAVSPTATISFPAGTTGPSPTATFVSIGTAISGTGKVLYSGQITPSILCGNGITPQLTTSTTLTET